MLIIIIIRRRRRRMITIIIPSIARPLRGRLVSGRPFAGARRGVARASYRSVPSPTLAVPQSLRRRFLYHSISKQRGALGHCAPPLQPLPLPPAPAPCPCLGPEPPRPMCQEISNQGAGASVRDLPRGPLQLAGQSGSLPLSGCIVLTSLEAGKTDSQSCLRVSFSSRSMSKQ